MRAKRSNLPTFATLLSGGLLIAVPFLDWLDPAHLTGKAHLEYRWRTTYEQPLAEHEISFQWLGVTGFKVQKGDFVLLIDPYVSRVPLNEFYRYFLPLEPNKRLLKKTFPKADYIFVTDSHFDHFLDVPQIALSTGAKVVGAPTTARLLRAYDVPEEQIITVQGGQTLQCGPFTVRVAKAQHGKIWFFDPFLHDAKDIAGPPLHIWDFGNMENRCYRFEADGMSFVATSGSDVQAGDIAGWRADLLMANVTSLPPGYIEKVIRITDPKVVFPTHYDNFFEPMDKGVKPFPIVDLQVFCDTVGQQQPDATLVTLDFFQEYRHAQ